MQCAAHPAAIVRPAAARTRVIRAVNFKNLAGARVFHDTFACDVIGVFEAHLAAGG